jgi:hypothetical protein
MGICVKPDFHTELSISGVIQDIKFHGEFNNA